MTDIFHGRSMTPDERAEHKAFIDSQFVPVAPLTATGEGEIPGDIYANRDYWHAQYALLLEKHAQLEAHVSDDIRELLVALGLGDHARPASPHRVMQDEILPAVRSHVSTAVQAAVEKAEARFDDRPALTMRIAGCMIRAAKIPEQDLVLYTWLDRDKRYFDAQRELNQLRESYADVCKLRDELAVSLANERQVAEHLRARVRSLVTTEMAQEEKKL